MLFSSFTFFLLFLPVTVAVYFLLTRNRLIAASKVWLALTSLVFYSAWKIEYLPLILISMMVNFGFGTALHRTRGHHRLRRSPILIAGVAFNLGLLGYYKYADFFISNVNLLTGADYAALEIALPLAISFFTFQQIAYLADCYQEDTKEYDFINYALFVTFFPQLIAGPIVHHGEMMPQFEGARAKVLNWKNIAAGLFVFSIGLFKKVVVADTFSDWVSAGYDKAFQIGFLDAWGASLSYTLQIYFDFSAYCDMAVGAALLLNIRLPVNFNSPYKALSIQDFWRRWHMTLSRWLRDYLYVPLGGNQRSSGRVHFNLMTTFLLGGLWHGAAWTFVAWGALHGLAMMVHKIWKAVGLQLPRYAAWSMTLLFVHVTWVFFRAESFGQAILMLKGMSGFHGFGGLTLLPGEAFVWLAVFLGIALFTPNAMQMIGFVEQKREGFRITFSRTWVYMLASALLAGYAIGEMLTDKNTEFLYFNF